MLSKGQALALVSQALLERCSQENPYVVIEDKTIENDECWVFFYTSKKHLETKEFRHRLIGNGPIIVDKYSGSIKFLGSKEYLRYYQRIKRNLFRFTIRDLLWLMVVVGLALGWLHQSRVWEHEKRSLIEQHESALANEKRMGETRAREAAYQASARLIKPPLGVSADRIRVRGDQLLNEELTPAAPLAQ
jgi:hypothetical protein